MKFSALTGCFYPEDLKYSDIPDDAIEVTEEDYKAAASRRPDQVLRVDGGRIVIVDVAVSASNVIKQKIIDLESQQTPRRIREAALGTDDGWLARLDAEIEELRAKL